MKKHGILSKSAAIAAIVSLSLGAVSLIHAQGTSSKKSAATAVAEKTLNYTPQEFQKIYNKEFPSEAHILQIDFDKSGEKFLFKSGSDKLYSISGKTGKNKKIKEMNVRISLEFLKRMGGQETRDLFGNIAALAVEGKLEQKTLDKHAKAIGQIMKRILKENHIRSNFENISYALHFQENQDFVGLELLISKK